MGLEDFLLQYGKTAAKGMANPFGEDQYKTPFSDRPGSTQYDMKSILEAPTAPTMNYHLKDTGSKPPVMNPIEQISRTPGYFDPRRGGSFFSPASWLGAVGNVADFPRYGTNWLAYQAGLVPERDIRDEDWLTSTASRLWDANPSLANAFKDPIPEGILGGAGWFAQQLGKPETWKTLGAMTAGAIMDMKSDPLTYLTIGAGPVLKQVSKYLNSTDPIRLSANVDEIPPVGNKRIFGEITEERVPIAADEYVRRNIAEEADRLAVEHVKITAQPSQMDFESQLTATALRTDIDRLREINESLASPQGRQLYEQYKAEASTLGRTGSYVRDNRGFNLFNPENKRRLLEAITPEERLRHVAQMSHELSRKILEDMPGTRFHIPGLPSAVRIPGISGKWWDPLLSPVTMWNAPRRLKTAAPITSRVGRSIIPAEYFDTKLVDLVNLDNIKGVPISPAARAAAQEAMAALENMDFDIPINDVKIGDIEPRLMAEAHLPGEAARTYTPDRPITVTEKLGRPEATEFKAWLDTVADRLDENAVALGAENTYGVLRPLYNFLYESSKLTPEGGLTTNTTRELKWTVKELDDWIADKRTDVPDEVATSTPLPQPAWSPSHRYYQQLVTKLQTLMPLAQAEVERVLSEINTQEPGRQISAIMEAGRLSDPAITKETGAVLGRFMAPVVETMHELIRLQPPRWLRMDKTAQQMELKAMMDDSYRAYTELLDYTADEVMQGGSMVGMLHALIRADMDQIMQLVRPAEGLRAGWSSNLRNDYMQDLQTNPTPLADVLADMVEMPGTGLVEGLSPGINKQNTGAYQFNRGIDLDPYEAWELRVAASYANGDLAAVLAAIHPRLNKLGMTYRVAAPELANARLGDVAHGNHLITIYAKNGQDLVLTAQELDEILTAANLSNPGLLVGGAGLVPNQTSNRLFYKYGSPSGTTGYISSPHRPNNPLGGVQGPPGPRAIGIQPLSWPDSSGLVRHYPPWMRDPFGGTAPTPAIREVVIDGLKSSILSIANGLLDDADALRLANSLADMTEGQIDNLRKNMGKYWQAVGTVTNLETMGKELIHNVIQPSIVKNMARWAPNSKAIFNQYATPMLEDITRMREIHLTNRNKGILPTLYKAFEANTKGIAKHIFRNIGQSADMIDDMEKYQFAKEADRGKAFNEMFRMFILGDRATQTPTYGFRGLYGILEDFGQSNSTTAWNRTKYDQLSGGYTRITQIKIKDDAGNLLDPSVPANAELMKEYLKGREMMGNALGITDINDVRIDAITKEISTFIGSFLDDLYRIELARGLNMYYRPHYLPIFVNGYMYDKKRMLDAISGGGEAVQAAYKDRARGVSGFFGHNIIRKHDNIGSLHREILELNAVRADKLDVHVEWDTFTILAKRLENHKLAMSTTDFLERLQWAHPDKVIPVKYTQYAEELGDFTSLMDRIPRTGLVEATDVPTGVPYLDVMGSVAAADYVRAELVLPEMRGWILRSDIAEYFKSFNPFQNILLEGSLGHRVWEFAFGINQALKKINVIWDLIMLKNLWLLALVGDIDVPRLLGNIKKYDFDVTNHPQYWDMVENGLFPSGNLEVKMPMRDLTYRFLQRSDPSWLSRHSDDKTLLKLREKTRQGPLGAFRNFASLKTEFPAVEWITWTVSDKFMRATLYEQALEMGMTKLDAARSASNIMIDYQMRWHSESTKKLGYGIFPFYAWLMGNMYQHLPRMAAHPRLYAMLGRAEDMVNRYSVGHDTEDNPAMFKASMMTPFFHLGSRVVVTPQKPWGSFEIFGRKLYNEWAKEMPGVSIPKEWGYKMMATWYLLAKFFGRRVHSNIFEMLLRPIVHGQRDLTKMENEALSVSELEEAERFFGTHLWGPEPFIRALNRDVPIVPNTMAIAQQWMRSNWGWSPLSEQLPYNPHYRFPTEGIINMFVPTEHVTPSGGKG